VVEVEGADRPGLLFDLARAIYDQNLSISSAIVATYGEKAMDVFYVRDLFGRKLTHPDRARRLEASLKDALAAKS
jgi:[protein-PII] uridylyltransferase